MKNVITNLRKRKFQFVINGEVKETSAITNFVAINNIRAQFPVGHLKPSEIQLTHCND